MPTPPTSPKARVGILGALILALCLHAGAASAGDAVSLTKDLDIRQVPMLDIKPEPAAAAAAAAGTELKVKASVDRSDRVYRHGDAVVLTVETSEDAYVWVYDTGTSGKVHQIFPNRHHDGNFMRANVPMRIPAEGASYQLVANHPRGAELITVIASKDAAPVDVEATGAAGPFLALRGTAGSVAKDISVSLKKSHPVWTSDQQVIYIQ
jgi:hypothetical protein